MMSGNKSGVAKLFRDIESSAIYTHCYGLAASDTVKRCNLMKNTLDTVHEICKLVSHHQKEMVFSSKLNRKYKLISLVYKFCVLHDGLYMPIQLKAYLTTTAIFWNCGVKPMRKQKKQKQELVLKV